MNRAVGDWGAERRLFFVALVVGGPFTSFGSLLGGLLMFLALYLGARWVIHADRVLLRIVLCSSNLRARYDPGTLAYRPEV